MFHFCLRPHSGALLASSCKGLCEEENAQALLEELTDSNSSSGDDSSGTDGMAVGEVIALECSDNEEYNVQGSERPLHLMPNVHLLFVWRIRQNYVGQRKHFVDNCGPQYETKNESEIVYSAFYR